MCKNGVGIKLLQKKKKKKRNPNKIPPLLAGSLVRLKSFIIEIDSKKRKEKESWVNNDGLLALEQPFALQHVGITSLVGQLFFFF